MNSYRFATDVPAHAYYWVTFLTDILITVWLRYRGINCPALYKRFFLRRSRFFRNCLKTRYRWLFNHHWIQTAKLVLMLLMPHGDLRLSSSLHADAPHHSPPPIDSSFTMMSSVARFLLRYSYFFFSNAFLGPFHGAIAVPSVTRCRCRHGHRCAGGARQYR